jgi:hypothetical protein
MYDSAKNQVPYCNVKCFKKWKFENFGPLIENGSHWINFTILTFINEKIDILDACIKFGTKFISFDMRKKEEI